MQQDQLISDEQFNIVLPQVNDWKASILQQLQHPYVDSLLENAWILPEKSFAYIEYFQASRLEMDRRDFFVEACLIVQSALDSHDLIKHQHEGLSQTVAWTSRLNVLIGDYFMAHFYQLFTESEQMPLFNQFLSGIKVINELKMSLLHDNLTAEQFLDIMEEHTMIFVRFIHEYLGFEPLSDQQYDYLVYWMLYRTFDHNPWFTLYQTLNNHELVLQQRLQRLNETFEGNSRETKFVYLA